MKTTTHISAINTDIVVPAVAPSRVPTYTHLPKPREANYSSSLVPPLTLGYPKPLLPRESCSPPQLSLGTPPLQIKKGECLTLLSLTSYIPVFSEYLL